MEHHNDNWPNVDDYIKFAESLIFRIRQLKDVYGVDKLERKIKSELKFLISLKRRLGQVNASHLKSSNLSHFASLVHASERLPGVVRVLQPFPMPSRPDSLIVDIVAGDGRLWVKVVARKAQALHLVWAGQGQFGERDLISQAEEYLECSRLHPHEFQTPQIVFVFYNQVTQVMSDALEQLGISVVGERVGVADDVQDKLGPVGSSDTEEEDSEGVCSGDDEVETLLKVCGGGGRDDATSRLSANSERPLSSPSPPVLSKEIEDSAASDVGGISNTSLHIHEQLDVLLSCDAAHQVSSNICDTAPFSKSSTTLDPGLQGVTDPPDGSITDGFPRPTGSGHSMRPALDSPADFSQPHFEVSLLPSAHLSLAGPCQLKRDLFLHLVVSPPAFDAVVLGTSVFSSLRTCPPIPRVNLDITSLIALVSSVTNGRCHLVFRDKVLTQQALEERETPILPILIEFLKGKELFVCETALSSFKSILDILGGEQEKERAEKFLASVRVVKDEPSARSLALDCQGRVKNRSKVIFGTGDTLQAVTVTSNMGFVRAAKSQGISFAVFLHQARALTEEKERFAVSLEN